MDNNILYIGLNGYAGSGKDTVAKMMHHILSKNWSSMKESKEQYVQNENIYATFNGTQKVYDEHVLCIAFADQLKNVCASMFGIPVDRFYYNKANAWICINNDFEYTESRPQSNYIVTAEDYFIGYSNYANSKEKYWMSLREILVYVGTYVCQRHINKNIFINIIKNTVKRKSSTLQYVIVTDVRFLHELEFIHNNNGVTINIDRESIVQLNNIAEHDLDDTEDFDYVIDNNGTYDDLFENVWNLLHDNAVFKNECIQLDSRDNTNNYLRLMEEHEDYDTYKLCIEHDIALISHNNGVITKIDPSGGPLIRLNYQIDDVNTQIPIRIYCLENKSGFYIDTKK